MCFFLLKKVMPFLLSHDFFMENSYIEQNTDVFAIYSYFINYNA